MSDGINNQSQGGDGMRLHLVLAMLGAVLFSFESWAFGSLSWIYGYGGGLETIPSYLALSYGDRNFSLWSPFVAGGLPRLAFWGNADPLSPEILMFSYLPTWLAYGLHRYLQYFMAIFFASRVCQEQFKLGSGWSTLAGWFHGAFAFMTTGALFTIAGVALLAWGLPRITKPSRGPFTALGAGLLFSLCTTFSFSVPYLLVFGAAWQIYVLRLYDWHNLKQFAFFALALVVAECPQVFGIMSCAALSHRAGWPAEDISWTIDGLFYRQLQFDMFNQDSYLKEITLTVPGLVFFFGIALLWFAYRFRPDLRPTCAFGTRVFAIYGISSQKWLWLGLQLAVSKIFPWVMGVYMGRFYQIPGAFLIACIFTFVSYISWQLVPVRMLRVAAASIVFAFISFMLLWPKVHLFYPLGVDDWGEKNVQVAALEEIKSRESEPFRVVSVLPLQPAYAYGQGLEAADGWANLFPAVYRDLWLRVIDPLTSTLPFVKNVFDPSIGKPQDNFIFMGADLIQPNVGLLPGEDAWACMRNGFEMETRFNLNLLRMLNVKYVLSEYPLKGGGLHLVHAPAMAPTFPQSKSYCTGLVHGARPGTPAVPGFRGQIEKAMHDYGEAIGRKSGAKDIYIYELAGALPRFRYVEEVSIEPTAKAVLDRLASTDGVGHARRAVMQSEDAASVTMPKSFSSGTARVTKYTSDIIELAIDNSGDGFLVISNTWDPHWKAEIDGQLRSLLRVNHAQVGLLTKAGESKVRLYYAPPYSLRQIGARFGTTK